MSTPARVQFQNYASGCSQVAPERTCWRFDLTLIPVEGFTGAKTPNEKTSVVPVSGLGEDAYYFAMKDGKFMSIRVMKGSSTFSISVRGGNPSVEQIKAIEKTLARKAVAKL